MLGGLWLFLSRNSSCVITSKFRYDRSTQLGKKTQIFIFAARNEFIIKHSRECFFISFEKHKKAKTNILRYAKYDGRMKVTDDLKRKIEQKCKWFAFRLTLLQKYCDRNWNKLRGFFTSAATISIQI